MRDAGYLFDLFLKLNDFRTAKGEPAALEYAVQSRGKLLPVAYVRLTNMQRIFKGRRATKDRQIANRLL